MPKQLSERELIAQRVASGLGAQQWGLATMDTGCKELPLKTVNYMPTPRRLNMVRLRVTFYRGNKFGMNVTVKFKMDKDGNTICRGKGTVTDYGDGNPGGYGGASRTFIQRSNGYFGWAPQ